MTSDSSSPVSPSSRFLVCSRNAVGEARDVALGALAEAGDLGGVADVDGALNLRDLARVGLHRRRPRNGRGAQHGRALHGLRQRLGESGAG
jgi:hypothetical protein